MNFATKLIVALITISATIIGSLWGAFEINDARMDRKDQAIKTEIMTTVHTLRDERNALIKAQDEKVSVQLVAIKDEMVEMKKDIRSILTLSRKSQVVFENKDHPQYTLRKQAKEEEKL